MCPLTMGRSLRLSLGVDRKRQVHVCGVASPNALQGVRPSVAGATFRVLPSLKRTTIGAFVAV